MRRIVSLLVAILAACAAFAPAVADAGQGAPRLVHLPRGTEAEALAVGPEGNLWFAGTHRGAEPGNVIGKIVAGGALEEFPVPESSATPGIGGLVLGPDGNMWFTEPAADRMLFEPPTGGGPGQIVVPQPGSRPTAIATVGNALWTTFEGTGWIGEFTPSPVAGRETALKAGWAPAGLALGDDNSVWVIDATAAEIVRRPVTGGGIEYIPVPGFAKGAQFTDIVAGPDGNLWLSQSDGSYIGRIDPGASRYDRFELPFKGGISLISTGPGGNLWFAAGGRIGSISTDGRSIGGLTCAISGCPPIRAIAKGPGGALWFAAGGTIGRFEPPPVKVVLVGDARRQGKEKIWTSLNCEGGAAGQRCQGKLELLAPDGSGAPYAGSAFKVKTGYRLSVSLKLSSAAVATLTRSGRLPVRLVAKVAGRIATKRNFVVRATR